jgi:hypothetical protein
MRDAIRRLRAIYGDRSPAADEAIAVMTFIRLGRAPEEDHECEVLDRGARMLPLLRRYHDAGPDTGFDLGHVTRRTSQDAADYRRLLGMLERAERCSTDDDD